MKDIVVSLIIVLWVVGVKSFVVGLIEKQFHDLELTGAYSIGMKMLPWLDLGGAYVTKDLNDFKPADVFGFGDVEFHFPDSVQYPCLPVKTRNGLIFPLSG